METLVFLVIVIVFLWKPISYAFSMYLEGGYSPKKRWFTVVAISIVFAVVGSSIGIVGFGGGIAGTIPGGLLKAYAGYQLANYLFPVSRADFKAVSVCPSCNGKAAVPSGRELLITCPHCSTRYKFGP
jgi:hypothetical protein